LLATSEDILLFVCGLGFLQGMLLAILIYAHPKSDRSVNTLLALYILFFSLVMTMPFVIKAITWRNSFFIQPVPLTVGPLLYLYIRSFKERITVRKALPHFIPFFVFFFFAYWNIDYMSNKYPEARIITPAIIRAPSTKALIYFRVSHLIIYFFLARRQLKTYRRSINHLFSETSVINFGWVNLLIYGFLWIVIANVVILPLMFRYPQDAFLLLLIDMALATPYIYVVTAKGISQPSVWQAQRGLKKEELEKEFQEAEVLEMHNTEHKREKAGKIEVDTKLHAIVGNVIELLENEKLYHEAELTLQQLANRLQLPTYLVSQAINEGLNKNFYELINSYRVETAKRLLVDPKNSNFTILSIGFEAGFNSKTTFNTVFKKFTGLTPTEYRDKHKLGVAVA